MQPVVIRVENLSKCYTLKHEGQGSGTGLRHALQDAVTAPFRRGRKDAPNVKNGEETFWALKDVNFEVRQGEVLGIIGRNGAGKSTLLKILSRITEPTKGRVGIKGRIASLLEVGTGFHPELTGRENIFLNGSILGMKRTEVRQKFDEIVNFAEVEKFLDTPVKRYSSGMYVRLAFAVAAHLDPEILIVDEVLAVGDAQFQKKCLGKMQDVATRGGRTVIFVSHNMGAMQQLTDKGLFLKNGNVDFVGDTGDAIDRYSDVHADHSAVRFDVSDKKRMFEGTGLVKIMSLSFLQTTPIFDHKSEFAFKVKVKVLEAVENMRFSMTIFTGDGTAVGSTFGENNITLKKGEIREVTVILPAHNLAPGRYYCGLAAGKGSNLEGQIEFDVVHETLQFEVTPLSDGKGSIGYWTKGWGSIVFPTLNQQLH